MELTKFIRDLFRELGITTAAEGLTPIEALDLVREKIWPIKDQFIDQAVQSAVMQSKLRPDEVDWARDLVGENGLEVFNYFVAKRNKVVPIATTLGSRPGSKAEPSADLQRSINAQVGVTEAQFLKYNSPAPSRQGPDEQLQARINRQLGVSEELFAKRGSGARR